MVSAVYTFIFDPTNEKARPYRILHKRPPKNHPIFHLIGHVAAEWAYLERCLDNAIAWITLADSDDLACLTAQMMGATPRYNAIIALLTHLKNDPKLRDDRPQIDKHIRKVNSLLQRTFEIQEKRNRIVHDTWYVDSRRKIPAQHRNMPRKDLHHGLRVVTLKEVRSTIAAIKNLTAQVEALNILLFDELPALRAKRHAMPPEAHPSSAQPGAE